MRALLIVAALTSVAVADDAFYGRIRDDAGPVAGFDAYARKVSSDATHCGGRAVTVAPTGKPVKPDDKAFAALLDLQPPRGLDFTDAHKKQSLERFNAWVSDVKRLGGAASDVYANRLPNDSAVAKLADSARIAQIMFQVTSTLARLEIPQDARTGEFVKDKIDAFCNQIQAVSAPLLERAELAVRTCADAAKSAPAGWWTAVCVSRP